MFPNVTQSLSRCADAHEECPCCRRDVAVVDHADDCANAPTEDDAIEMLANIWWSGRGDELRDSEGERANAQAARHTNL